MELKPSWVSKTDPEKHPVRFLASIWQQRMKANFGLLVIVSPKEYGQLRDLRMHLGNLTQGVIEWIVDPIHWWHFCQQVRKESKNHRVSERPDIGLLLLRRGSALRVMRSKLSDSPTGGDFIKKLEQRNYEQVKALTLVYADHKPELLTKVEAAKTLADMQRVFIEMTD
jgi:hypothetical protein